MGKLPHGYGSMRVLTELERLCSVEGSDASGMKQMSAEDRAFLDVVIIDSLNSFTAEDRERLRLTLLRYGYDEQCARRAMSGVFSEQVRAMALLKLLRRRRDDSTNRLEDRQTEDLQKD